MNPIAQIIFDVLASGRGINLPEVGSLSVERDAARFVSKSEVRPPHNKVVFSTGENPDFESIIDVMTASGEDPKEAQSRYADWLAKAKTNRKMIEISEVGVLKNDVFYPSARLHDTLNPGNVNTVRLSKNSGAGRMAAIIGLGILIVCAVVFLIFALNRYMAARNNSKAITPTEQAYTTDDKSATDGKSSQEDLTVGEPDGSADGSEPAASTDAITHDDKAAVSNGRDNANIAATETGGKECRICAWFRGMFAKKDKGVTVAVADSGESKADTPAPSDEVTDAKNGQSVTDNRPVVTVNRECPIYHVVIGVFADPANADRIIAEDPMNIGCRAYNRFPFKGMTMVTAFSSNSKPQADAKRREFARIDRKVWIYVEE